MRKYLPAGSAEPQFQFPERSSKLDPYADKVADMLRVETGKARSTIPTKAKAMNVTVA